MTSNGSETISIIFSLVVLLFTVMTFYLNVRYTNKRFREYQVQKWFFASYFDEMTDKELLEYLHWRLKDFAGGYQSYVKQTKALTEFCAKKGLI